MQPMVLDIWPAMVKVVRRRTVVVVKNLDRDTGHDTGVGVAEHVKIPFAKLVIRNLID